MKTSIKAKLAAIFFLTAMLSFGNVTNAQSHKSQSRHEKVVKANRSVRHKRHVKANYHPHWAKKTTYSRRWVYFPKYNFYWDNVRSKYVYLNNGVWVVKKKKPSFIVNVDLEAEKAIELSEDEDAIDSIQDNNASHSEQKTD